MLFLQRAHGENSLYYVTHLLASVLPMATQPNGTVTVLPASEGMVTQSSTGSARVTAAARTTLMVHAGMPLEQFVQVIRSAR
jgi:hypothetical protein